LIAFGGILNDIADAAGKAGEAIANWTKSENFAEIKDKVEKLTETARNFVKMMNNPIGRTKSLQKLGVLIGLAFEIGAKKAVNILIAGVKAAWLGVRGKDIDFGELQQDFVGVGNSVEKFKEAGENFREYVAIINEIETVVESTADKQKTAGEDAMQAAKDLKTKEDEIAAGKADAAKAEAEAGAARVKDAKALKAANEQIANVQKGIRAAEEQDRIAAAGGDIEKAQGNIALLARTRDQRRADEKAQRKADFDERKGRDAQAKRREGRGLSKNEKKLAALADERDKIQIAENLKKVAEANLKQMAMDDRQNQIDQLKELRLIKDDLADNLKAAGG